MLHIARTVIKETSDKDFDPEYNLQINREDYHVRKAARGIVSHNGKIALLHVTKYNYHKLPGGGVEEGEMYEEAFKREVLEETGCECIVEDEDDQNPVTIETLDKMKLLHISYIFSADVKGTPKDVRFTQNDRYPV